MSQDVKTYDRRQFLELAAAGAVGTAALGLSTPSAFASTPKRGGTITCGVGLLMQTPDPHRYTGGWGRQCIAPCWEGLTTPTPVAERARLLKEQGPDAAIPEVQPMLADNWEMDKEGRRYVFHLKKGVQFHNGKELNSEDVAWSWKRIQDPIHISAARQFLTVFLESIETPDRYTVVANLSQSYGAFLMANAWCFTVILPKNTIPYGSIWGFTPTFKPPSVAPPGTGPFQMVEYQQIHRAVYERFDDYRIDGLPYLDRIIYKVMSQDGPRTMALRAGNLDYTWSVENNWLAKQLEGRKPKVRHHFKKDNINFYPYINLATRTIYMNMHPDRDTPFKDERVRKALDYCIDRKILAKALYGDLAIPKVQGFNPDISAWGFTDIKGRERDITKARALLKEAGYPNGLDVEFKITPVWGKNDLRAQIIQQMAKPAGFRISIVSQIGSQYGANFRTYNYQMMMQNLSHEDPMNFHYNYLHTDPAVPYNGLSPRLGIKDAEMDRLLDQTAQESDVQKRRAVFKKVVQRMIDKAYLIPHTQEILSSAWSDRLKNFKPWAYYQFEQAFAEAWVED
ncbi:MAG: ABC transporter substrate-binding protein [bacterium]|nr:ABC transporter substrate-binding protein [bacterium]